MKLEKREISLNELDSVVDAMCIEKLLLTEYVYSLERVKRKEIRATLLESMKQIGEDLFVLSDLKLGCEKNDIQ